MTRPDLRIVPQSPWSDPRSYAPELTEALARNEQRLRRKPGWFATLGADARELIDEISEHPVSHLLVGLATFLGTMLLIFGPLLIAERVL